MQPDVLALGYTCICGERVTLMEMTRGETTQLPYKLTTTCPNGHVSTFTARQIGAMELWTDHADSAPPLRHAA